MTVSDESFCSIDERIPEQRREVVGGRRIGKGPVCLGSARWTGPG
jgi:hypothetical protein